MKVGSLRHRVAIQSASLSQNSMGEAVSSWSTGPTVWASIEPLSGNESNLGPEVVAGATHKITVRYNSAITPTKRLLFGSRAFDVNSVLNFDERNHYQTLLCKEAV